MTLDYSAWIHELLINLDRCGPEAAAALRFIEQRRTKVSVHDQPTGARWTVGRRIQIHPRYAGSPPDDPRVISLMIHEVRHLQQGPLIALSVYGEMEAWQLQFRFLKSKVGHYHQEPHLDSEIQLLMSLPLGWDRRVLQYARTLMQDYAGKAYRIDLLPLYPLPREIVFRLTRAQPRAHRSH
jgi:hypothetical protein